VHGTIGQIEDPAAGLRDPSMRTLKLIRLSSLAALIDFLLFFPSGS
jgi:hypothetical protein